MSHLSFNSDDLPEPTPAQAAAVPMRGTPRLRVPIRDQVEISWASLDERLDPDSQARVVWTLVCKLDLSAWLDAVTAVQRPVGRPAPHPRLPGPLWVLAPPRGRHSAPSRLGPGSVSAPPATAPGNWR